MLKFLKKAVKKIDPWAVSSSSSECDMAEDDDPMSVDPVRFVPRSKWTSKEPKYRVPLKTPVKIYAFRFWSDTPRCFDDEQCFHYLRTLQDKHMADGMPDIAYNFVISSDGSVYEGRGWYVEPSKHDWYLLPYHQKSIDIAYMGDWKDIYVEDSMNQAACRMMKRGVYLGVADTDREAYEERRDPPTSWDRLAWIQKTEQASRQSLESGQLQMPVVRDDIKFREMEHEEPDVED